jgi:hypothetical protein
MPGGRCSAPAATRATEMGVDPNRVAPQPDRPPTGPSPTGPSSTLSCPADTGLTRLGRPLWWKRQAAVSGPSRKRPYEIAVDRPKPSHDRPDERRTAVATGERSNHDVPSADLLTTRRPTPEPPTDGVSPRARAPLTDRHRRDVSSTRSLAKQVDRTSITPARQRVFATAAYSRLARRTVPGVFDGAGRCLSLTADTFGSVEVFRGFRDNYPQVHSGGIPLFAGDGKAVSVPS